VQQPIQLGDGTNYANPVLLRQVTSPTELLYFSLNQGQCWYTVRLEEAIDVQNIRCSTVCNEEGAEETYQWSQPAASS